MDLTLIDRLVKKYQTQDAQIRFLLKKMDDQKGYARHLRIAGKMGIFVSTLACLAVNTNEAIAFVLALEVLYLGINNFSAQIAAKKVMNPSSKISGIRFSLFVLTTFTCFLLSFSINTSALSSLFTAIIWSFFAYFCIFKII